ncbi:hypothetical protein DM01DRAFT_1389900 [Hesseltinella vesiculosa]|uniref:PH domain-containing protein n=1 Tax=Hesseltinella vesiculosa TaxID=101127 RepID=A0A1X2GIE1_9FUNG|nr:hypothetical protein DM01DRAFT_1389900 [Hesseltinella vesiculosa]
MMMVAPSPRPSLSESALTCSSPRTNGKLRPSRFIRPTMTNPKHHDQPSLTQFINTYDRVSQKLYMEGYVMHQQKKYFMELCGATLALWDVDRPGATVLPDYMPLMNACHVQPIDKQQCQLDLANKSWTFATLDPGSLTRWIGAIRLANFEQLLLHQQFTFALFQQRPPASQTVPSFLQILFPNSKKWKKQWCALQKPSKRTQPSLVLADSKKLIKTPTLTLSHIHRAYALYPETASLVPQSTLIRLEATGQDGQPVVLLLMTDTPQQLVPWLATLYKTFQLYGLPDRLLDDPTNPHALNFGQRSHPTPWWLETNDTLATMTHAMSPQACQQQLAQLLCQKQQSPLPPPIHTQAPLPPLPASAPSSASSPLTASPTSLSPQRFYDQQQTRANSLPTIMIDTIDAPRQRATSDAGLLKKNRLPLLSNVADSSDESEEEDEEEEEDQEPEEQQDIDSDDEPIGKSKPLQPKPASGPASWMLDFDFDLDSSSTTSTNPLLLSLPMSTTSSTRSSRLSPLSTSLTPRRVSQQPSSSSSSHSSHSSSSQRSQPAHRGSSIFGDFALSTDFSKCLDPTVGLPRLSTNDRKFSLPARPSWEPRTDSPWPSSATTTPRSRFLDDEDELYQDGDDEEEGRPRRRPILLDDDDDDDSFDDCPLIPALHDHFAPQNSLLDHHLGEQLSAKEQIEYARATGQPLIQMPSKPRPPKGGLVGMISERERHRKQGSSARVNERIEREKERRLWEQRHQLYMKQQIMMYNNGYIHPMMVHPTMPPPSPMMSPGSPLTSPMPSSPNGYYYGRPYSPTMSYGSTGTYPPSPSSPHHGRRASSRPVLEQDEPLYTQFSPRTGSPPIFRKMHSATSSPASSSIHL